MSFLRQHQHLAMLLNDTGHNSINSHWETACFIEDRMGPEISSCFRNCFVLGFFLCMRSLSAVIFGLFFFFFCYLLWYYCVIDHQDH